MKALSLLLLLPLLTATALDWKNDVIKRTVYLNSAVVREDLSITATALQPAERYLVKVQPGRHVVAYKAVKLSDRDPEMKEPLPMTEIAHDHKDYIQHCLGPKDERYRCFWVQLPSKLAEGGSVQLVVGLAYRNLLHPVPEEAEQNDPLAVLYEDSAYVLSPYPTARQKTSVALSKAFRILAKGAPVPHQLDKAAASAQPGLVQYSCGVYEGVAGHEVSSKPLRFHFHLHDAALATIERLERSLTVLPWFNLLTVTEHYTIHHDGFRTKDGRFERSLFLKAVQQREAHVQYVGAMPIIIPASSYDIQVRDENGRLTGHHQRQQTSPLGPNYHQYNVAMRYPLTGGWTTRLEIHYKLPLDLFLSRNGKNELELSTLLFSSFFDVAVKELSLRFNLPEDAIVQSYHYDHLDSSQISENQSTYKTYFSTKGEQVLELQMSDLCRNHVQPIRVVFSYPWWGTFRKPAAMLLSLIFILACFRLGASVDLSVSRGKERQRLEALLKLRRETVASLDDLIIQMDRPEGQVKRKALLQDLTQCTQGILTELRALVNADPALSIQGAALKKLYEEHLSCINSVFERSTTTKKGLSKSQSVDVVQMEKDVIELDQAILKHEAKLFK